MRLTVHNVGLGQFITLVHESGHTMFWDAGTKDDFTPADFCIANGIDTIDRLFITNFDQDHLSGLPDLVKNFKIRSLYRNNLVSADYLRALKLESGPITVAMEAALRLHETYVHPVAGDLVEFPDGVSVRVFRNRPSDEIADTNNLSLVTVLECRNTKFVISGDLERPGWDALVRDTDVLKYLPGTNVFVASHHGRENGYHEVVMNVASPDCVVMSDYGVKHATQESLQLYRRHCKGISLNGEQRHILTTRKDDTFWWDI